MGNESKKTEHSGAKKGNGAYWGFKKDAKSESNKQRRENGKIELAMELNSHINSSSYREALGRARIQLSHLEDTLENHPAILSDDKAEALDKEAIMNLSGPWLPDSK